MITNQFSLVSIREKPFSSFYDAQMQLNQFRKQRLFHTRIISVADMISH